MKRAELINLKRELKHLKISLKEQRTYRSKKPPFLEENGGFCCILVC